MIDLYARRVLAAAAALTLAAPAAAASDSDSSHTFRVTIPTADLDLASPAGQKALLKRSRGLARRTCAPEPYPVVYDSETLEQCHAAFARAAETAIARSNGEAQRGTR